MSSQQMINHVTLTILLVVVVEGANNNKPNNNNNVKKLLTAFLIITSVISYAQKEKVMYYKYQQVISGEKIDTYNAPSKVTYFFNNDYYVKIEVDGESYIYPIDSTPTKEFLPTGDEYLSFKSINIENNLVVYVWIFKDTAKSGIVVTDYEVSYLYTNQP